MGEAGRPSLLTEELFAKIKKCVFQGMSLRDMAKACEVSEHTVYTWHEKNYANFRDKVEGWRRDNKLEMADMQLDNILKLDPSEKEFTPSILKASLFVKETLDKPYYSKRQELTGADGKDLPTPIMAIERNVSGDNSNTEDQGAE